MKRQLQAQPAQNPKRPLPLQLILIVPFVIQIFAAVGVTGWLSIRNGQEAVNNVAAQLREQVSARAKQYLDSYLQEPYLVNQFNAKAFRAGQLNLEDSSAIAQTFLQEMATYRHFSYIYVGGENGESVSVGWEPQDKAFWIGYRTQFPKRLWYAVDEQGQPIKNLPPEEETFDPRTRPWYTGTIKAKTSIWSGVYPFSSGEGLGITAGVPLYDPTQKLRGVLAIDFFLSEISKFLQKLKFSPAGQIFIIERSGNLIASSTKDLSYVATPKGGEPKPVKAIDGSNPSIRAATQYLIKYYGNLQQIQRAEQIDFQLNGQRQFVQILPYRDPGGIDWLVVTLVPESDFMAQINSNTRITIWSCLGALGIAIVLGIYTSRWISRPILRLAQASKAIAVGELDQQVVPSNVKELSILARSFNHMAQQLQDSFTVLEKTNEALEQHVEERTIELKTAKEAADTASRAKSEFLASMSHELRTPLNGILGYAQILQRDRTISPKQQDGIAVIQQCGSHLLTLINDVLDISKIEAQKLELYPTAFEFENFLRGVQEICRVRAEQKEIAFNYQVLNRLPFAVYADEKRLRQVLINLLNNAIKFTEAGSVTFKIGIVHRSPSHSEHSLDKIENISLRDKTRLSVALDQTTVNFEQNENDNDFKITHRIRFQVEDTGVGITTEQLEKIFLPFEQVGEQASRIEGTGLGLTISQRIIELMKSEINVESTYGKGSTFWFDLDLPEASEWSALKPAPSQTILGYQGEPKTILVVDDRWENRTILINLLTPIGFKLIEATNGQEGFEQAQRHQPDLIITDLTMPVMDGLQMTQQLRQFRPLQHAIVIASSASVFAFDRQQSHTAGCDDFLPKPVQAGELFDQLQRHLKLQWIYEQPNATPFPQAAPTAYPSALIAPPAVELTTLYKAAKAGYIGTIQQEAHRLKQLDEQYIPFAEQILKLAEVFEDGAIVQLVQPYVV